MPTDYDFIPNLDPMELDRRLSIVLGEEFNPGSPNLDPIEIDRRIATAPPPVPPGPTPIDYTYGSINYKEEFATVPKNSIIRRDGKILISMDAAYGSHCLFAIRIFVPELLLKTLCTYHAVGCFAQTYQAGDMLYEGKLIEGMSMVVFDSTKDFSSEPIQVDDYVLSDCMDCPTPIDIPGDLLAQYHNGDIDLRLEKGFTVLLERTNGDKYVFNPHVLFSGYNIPKSEWPYYGSYGGAWAGHDYISVGSYQKFWSSSSQEDCVDQKKVYFKPGAGLCGVFKGLLNPYGYVIKDEQEGIITPEFIKPWKYDGLDGLLFSGTPGEAFSSELAKHVPEEWNNY